jgi:uncharacterized protein (TIGR03083 family)
MRTESVRIALCALSAWVAKSGSANRERRVTVDKSTLVNEITTGYTAFDALVAPLTDAQLTTPGVVGDWSIKDVLAHLTAWHVRLLDLLDAAVRGTEPAMPAADVSDDEIDRMNARFHEERRTRSLGEVQAELRTSYARVVDDVRALADDDLNSTDRWIWLRGVPLWQFVRGDTYEHYAEHGERIRAWLAR